MAHLYKKGYIIFYKYKQLSFLHTKRPTMVTAFELPKSPSSQLKTVLDYFDLVRVLNLAELEKLFTDDFVQTTLPSSLGVPSRTKQEDLAFLRGLSEQLEGRHIQVRYQLVSRNSLARAIARSSLRFPAVRSCQPRRWDDGSVDRPNFTD